MLQAKLLGPDISPGCQVLDSRDTDPSSSRPRPTPTRVVSPSTNLEGDQEELAWSGSTLVWSRGCQVYRQMSFDHYGEEVAFALFAPFRLGEEVTTPTAGKKGKEKETSSRSDTFGPFHTSHQAQWGQPKIATAALISRLERTLVVFLQTKAYIFFPSGREAVVHMPFAVDKAWPLGSGGVIVQRRFTSRSSHPNSGRGGARSFLGEMNMERANKSILDTLVDMDEDDGERVARLWTLERPFEELKVLCDDSPDVSTFPASCDVLHVAQDPCPLVIVHEKTQNRLDFYRRQRRKMSADPITSPVIAPRTVSENVAPPHESAVQRKGRPSLTRNPSGFGQSAVNDRRLSGMADPLERTTRRAPRLSRGSAPDKEPVAATAEGDLHATLDPPPFSMTVSKPPPKGRARNGSHTSSIAADKSDRRTSSAFVTGDDGPLVRHTGLAAIAEKDLRETTMMMGLEKREEAIKSDISLVKFASWRCPPEMLTGSLRAFESDGLWPQSVNINVHATSQLFVFKVTAKTAALVRTMACIDASPIISTRHKIHDTLVISPDGGLHIVTSDGQSIGVAMPSPTADSRDEVARRMASSLNMQIDTDDSLGARSDTRRVVALGHSTGSTVTLLYNDHENMRVSVDFTIKDRLVRHCFEAASRSLSATSFFTFKRELLARLQTAPLLGRDSAWTVFVDVVRASLGMTPAKEADTDFGQLVTRARQGLSSTARRLAALHTGVKMTERSRPIGLLFGQKLEASEAASLLFALHLVAQELRVAADLQVDVPRLGGLVLMLAGHMGMTQWFDYWRRLVPTADDRIALNDPPPKPVLEGYETPPDILHHLKHSLCFQTRTFPTLDSVSSNHSELGRLDILPRTRLLCEIYNRLSCSLRRPAVVRAHETVHWMVKNGVKIDWIQCLSFGVAIPIWEMIRICQQHPPRNWSAREYGFIDRTDLAAKVDCAHEQDHAAPALEDEMPAIGDLLKNDLPDVKTQVATARPHVRFGSDKRVAEIERIMQTTRVRTMSIEDPPGASEQDVLVYQQNLVNIIAHRTLSITVAAGIFEYGTRQTTVTDVCQIPTIELSIKVVPANTVLKAQLQAENADWPCFHNGVSAALAISPDCKGIDSSWIVFNKPPSLTPEHGGFLLGLGLNGHLRSLLAYHAFPYMEPRHDYTSCGLLLGLGCSFAGSQDPLCTRVLSLHTHALLPLGSAELNASPIIQSSALVGLGLIHAGTRHLRMAELALGEIGRRELQGVDRFVEHQEAYSFAASMSFALIMLGRGGRQTSEVDRRLLTKLRRCIVGDSSEGHNPSLAIDTTITAPGATLALGLMYLKTGECDIRDMLEIPQTAFDIDHVRPDVLLLRTLARALIMWDEINPSMDWIKSQMPTFIQAYIKPDGKPLGMDIASELAYFNIVAGACLAISLKFAGTASEIAHSNLINMYGVLAKASAGTSMSYEGKIRRQAARQCLNIVTLALGTVTCGTGELHALRRFRISHGQEGAGVTYGTHMANHMAIGLLFLGRGHYTLGNSNMAIAAMCIAFFPRFQSSPSDNKAYPQAFRHLWALAIEPRCIAAKDVDTKETIYLPIKIRSKVGDKVSTQHLISPTLISPFESIGSIETENSRYWPNTYDLADPKDRQSLVKTRTLWVKRKLPHLEYHVDQKGNRGLNIRMGSMSKFELHHDLLSPAAPPTVSASEVQSLVAAYAPSPYLLALSRLHNGDTAFDRFVREVLLECIALDKPRIIGVYISIWLALHGSPGTRCDTIAHFDMAETLYTPGTYERFIASSSSSSDLRQGWIRPNFLTVASRQIKVIDVSDKALVGYFVNGTWTDEIGLYLDKNHVPPLDFLRAVCVLVQGSTGDSVRAIEERVRDAARQYAQALQTQYALPGAGGIADAKVWKLESLREVVGIWIRSTAQ